MQRGSFLVCNRHFNSRKYVWQPQQWRISFFDELNIHVKVPQLCGYWIWLGLDGIMNSIWTKWKHFHCKFIGLLRSCFASRKIADEKRSMLAFHVPMILKFWASCHTSVFFSRLRPPCEQNVWHFVKICGHLCWAIKKILQAWIPKGTFLIVTRSQYPINYSNCMRSLLLTLQLCDEPFDTLQTVLKNK